MIGRPVSTVWDFYAVNHVQNHPRWDPGMELEAIAGGPIGVGSVIKRRATRFGETTEGTMDVVGFEPHTAMRVEIQDGPLTINGWALFESKGENRTRMVIGAEFVGMDDSMESEIRPMIERSAARIKALIEAET